jgi:site-specific DNA recombinase
MRDPQAALYARVSSEQQAHSRTIASQVASLRERIAADGVRLEPEHVFLDEGYSGATLLRPALERLRDAVAAGAIDRIYVHSPDRLARRYAYQVLLIEEFHRAGADVVFLNRPIGGSAEDDLLLQVQGMIAEYERAKILERGRRGRRHAARSGSVSALCAAPFGYRYIAKAIGGGVARFEVVDEEARIVRQIFAWIGLERVSLHEVCRRLAEAGCRTRTGLVRWDPTTVCGMLRNPAYIGQAAFGRSRFVPAQPRLRPIRGRPWPSRKANTRIPIMRDEWITVPVPALVEPALFAAAQDQLEGNRRHRRERRRRPGWLLQGLVVCRRCGYAFYGKMARGKVGGGKKAEYGYYRCLGTDGHRFGGVAPCDNRSVRSDCLELAVWNEIRALLEDPSRLAAEYRRRLDELHQDTGDRGQAAALDRQIDGLRRGIGRLIDSYAEGVIDHGEFQPRIAGLRERLARVKKQRQALIEAAETERSLTLVIGRVEDFAAKVQHSLDELDWQGTREIIRVLVRRVEIDGDAVELVFRVPPLSADDNPGGARPNRGDLSDRQHCGSGHRGLAREDADHVGPPLHLLVEALQRIGGVQLGPVLGRKRHVGQHVVLTVVHEAGELGPTWAELVGELPPGLPGGVLVRLQEGLTQGRRHHAVLALGHMRERVPHPMDSAPLPGGAQHLADGVLEPFVRVGDHQLDPAQAPSEQGLQECRPERLRLGRAQPRPTISRLPSVLTATAIMAATETIRPPSRTFR